MKRKQFIVFTFAMLIGICEISRAQTILNANGPGNTYELINSVLAPNGGDVVEHPECVHPEFGRHIAEVWDATLNKYVFEFYIHVTPDNDRCINFDRQRMEIKTYEPSPANLKGTIGETVVYKWRFKLPTGFQPSSNFTHLHQIKAVGGDESDPIFVLTARKGNPNKLELNYYESSNSDSEKLTFVDLSLFEGKWVNVTERIKYDTTNGSYSIIIKNVSTGATILNYSNNQLLTFRPDNTFTRPKWGIYRSLLSSEDLRDEAVRFSDISIQEENPSEIKQFTEKLADIRIEKIEDQLKIIGLNISKVSVIDASGKVLDLNPLTNTSGKDFGHISVDISDFPAGLFMIRCFSNDLIATKKILVSR